MILSDSDVLDGTTSSEDTSEGILNGIETEVADEQCSALASISSVLLETSWGTSWGTGLGLLDCYGPSEVLLTVQFKGSIDGACLSESHEGDSLAATISVFEKVDTVDGTTLREEFLDVVLLSIIGKATDIGLVISATSLYGLGGGFGLGQGCLSLNKALLGGFFFFLV